MEFRHKKISTILTKVSLSIALLLALYACSNDEKANPDRDLSASASYKVSFTSTWTATVFPTNFPSGPHFSGLIGGTHNNQVIFWETWQMATDGIESMAETGSQGGVSAEVSVAIADGKAEFILSGPGNSAAATVELEFDINEAYPLVTLVSMVAPSPDWFVGVRDLALFDDNAGDWKQTIVVDLSVYDAGTDSGTVFIALDADTQPVDPISLLSSAPVETDFINGVGPGGEFIATMTFERIK